MKTFREKQSARASEARIREASALRCLVLAAHETDTTKRRELLEMAMGAANIADYLMRENGRELAGLAS